MGQIPAEEPIGMPIHNWQDEEELPAPAAKPKRNGTKKTLTTKQRIKRTMVKYTAVLAVIGCAGLWGVYTVGNFYRENTTELQSPIIMRWPVKVEKRTELPKVEEPKQAKEAALEIIPVAKAAEVEKETAQSFPQAR